MLVMNLNLKIFVLILFVFIIGVFSACKSNQLAKEKAKANNMKILDSLYQLNDYKIEIEVVYPFNTAATIEVANALLRNTGNNANRIDVRGDGNYIQIKNDTLTGYLPFFGERRLNAGGLGGSNSAIQFNEPLTEFNKNINDKGILELSFPAKQLGDDNDKYNVRLNIYPNMSVSADITPVFRTFMKYDGRLVDINEED
jgi:archaellum component FlaF (FlaF/FlaG flagellin family)